VSQWVVSPKLTNSGNLEKKRYKPDVLQWFTHHHSYFKFVVGKISDLLEVDEIVKDINIPPQRVMIMPEGTTVRSQLDGSRRLVDEILKRGYGLSMREHVLVWGNERAR
jgi:hypothetical protein